MIGHLSDIAVAASILFLATGAGAGLLRIGRIRANGVLEQGVISFSLGFAFVSYLLFGLGSLGWLNIGMVLFVLVCAALLGLPVWLDAVDKLRKDGVAHPRFGSIRWRTHWTALLLGGAMVTVAFLNLIASLAPPTEWDTLSYHLTAVKYFIDQGKVQFVPYQNWALPMASEMWNMLGLLLGSDRLPQIFQWAAGLGSAGALYVLAAGRTSQRTGILAAAIYYTSAHVVYLSSSAKSDLVWFIFVFLSLHALLTWKERKSVNWLLLSAVLTGLSLGTRLQSLFWAPGIGLALVVLLGYSWRQAPLRATAWVTSYGVIASLVALPWWLRNWLAAGDPIWPYGYPIFHSRFWTQELYDKYAALTQGAGEGLWQYVGGLWNLSVNASAWNFGLRFPITPLILAFLPALLLQWRNVPARARLFFGVLLVPAAVYYTLWFNTYQNVRFLFPILALLMIPAAYSFWQMGSFRLIRLTSALVLTMVLFLFVGYGAVYDLQFASVVFGAESRDEFLSRKVSFYDDIQWVNKNLPTDAKLLSYHSRVLYLERDFMRSDSNLWELDGLSSADDLLDLLRERGVTHVFLPRRGELVNEIFLAELEASGFLHQIYSNPAGVKVESRTLSEIRRMPVSILEVVYPSTSSVQAGPK